MSEGFITISNLHIIGPPTSAASNCNGLSVFSSSRLVTASDSATQLAQAERATQSAVSHAELYLAVHVGTLPPQVMNLQDWCAEPTLVCISLLSGEARLMH